MNRSRVFACWWLALTLGTVAAWADNKSIQGTLLGLDGNPMADQEIKADRLDAKGTPRAITKTDAQGHYQFKALPVGAYSITAYVKNAAKLRAMVKTRDDGWAKVDFDLRTRRGDPNIKKHWVWVKGEPGTHIGGHWVEVDEAIAPASTNALDSTDLSRVDRTLRMNTTATRPGR
ncbi:MAG: carboxypeptidase-like regulatory domain-containing protein [Chthoniobacterales bacterium]